MTVVNVPALCEADAVCMRTLTVSTILETVPVAKRQATNSDQAGVIRRRPCTMQSLPAILDTLLLLKVWLTRRQWEHKPQLLN